MTIDTNELRRLAQAATPGPWYVTGKLTRYVEARIDGGLIQEVAACGPTKADGGYGPQQEANARLIAAANPAAISELLDRLEEAEKERGSAMMLVDRLALALNTSNHERDALRAKIAEMEQQEPVAWGAFYFGGKLNGKLYSQCDTEAQIDMYIADRHQSDDSNTFRKAPLYALPGAKGEGK